MRAEKIEKLLEAYWHKVGSSEPARQYLGASIIGHECERYLWLYFRGAFREDFSGRLYRLFDRGRREEDTFVRELRGIGCRVWDCDPMTRQQWAVSAFGGLFGGHLDGMAQGVPGLPPDEVVVVEFKTHSDKSFSDLKKNGVQASKPQHFAQMTIYMGTEKRNHALYLAVNKNTDEVYAEIVEFKKNIFENLLLKAYRVMTSDEALPRCASRPDDWRCRYCAAREICWGADDGRVCACNPSCLSCRTCRLAAANTETGTWECPLCNQMELDKATPCKYHILLTGLVHPDARPNGLIGGDAMSYKYNCDTFENGGPDGFASSALCSLTLDQCIDGELKDGIRAASGSLADPKLKSVPGGETIEERFPRGSCPVLWVGPSAEWKDHVGETWEITDQETDTETGITRYEFDGDKMLAISSARKQAYIVARKGAR